MTVPAGWYPDPGAPGSLRYHDGTAWTSHTATPAAARPDEPATAAAPLVHAPVPATVGAPSAATRPASPAPAREQPATAAPTPYATATLPPVVMPIGVDGPVAADSSPTVIPDRVVDPEAEHHRRRWIQAGAAGGALLLAAGAWALLVDHGPSGVEAVQQAFAEQAASRVVDAPGAARVLETMRTPVAAPYRWELIKGGVTLSQGTFAGFCGLPAAVDADRIARRQWALKRSGTWQPVSLEVVAYRSASDAASAWDDVDAALDRCRNVTRGSGAARTVSTATTVTAFSPPVVGAQGALAVVKATGRVDGEQRTLWSSAVMEQRGQFLTVVWSTFGSAPTRADLAALDTVAYQQAVRLATTPMP